MCPNSAHVAGAGAAPATHDCQAFHCFYCNTVLTRPAPGRLVCPNAACPNAFTTAIAPHTTRPSCNTCNRVRTPWRATCGWCLAAAAAAAARAAAALAVVAATAPASSSATPAVPCTAAAAAAPPPPPPPPRPRKIYLVPFSAPATQIVPLGATPGVQNVATVAAMLAIDPAAAAGADSTLQHDVVHFFPQTGAPSTLADVEGALAALAAKNFRIAITPVPLTTGRFLPLLCERFVWTDPRQFRTWTTAMEASLTHPTTGSFLAARAGVDVVPVLPATTTAATMNQLLRRIDVPNRALPELLEKQFLLDATAAVAADYIALYQTFSLVWQPDAAAPAPGDDAVNAADQQWATVRRYATCARCTQTKAIPAAQTWDIPTLATQLGTWTAGAPATIGTTAYPCIDARNLSPKIRAFLAVAIREARKAANPRIVLPLDPEAGVVHTAHWDLPGRLPWPALAARTAFQTAVAAAFRASTEVEPAVAAALPASTAAHVIARRAADFPATMEIALPVFGAGCRMVISYEAPNLTRGGAALAAPLVFLSAHYQVAAAATAAAPPAVHYVVTGIDTDPILHYCCETGWNAALAVIDRLTWFLPAGLAALGNDATLRECFPYNWKGAPAAPVNLVECTDGYRTRGVTFIQSCTAVVAAVRSSATTFQDIFAPFDQDGGLYYTEPWSEGVDVTVFPFVPDCHVSVRGARTPHSGIVWTAATLQSELDQRYDMHITMRPPWKTSSLSIGRMGVPTFYIYYRICIDKTTGLFSIERKRLSPNHFKGSRLMFGMCWQWAATTGTHFDCLTFMEDRVQLMNLAKHGALRATARTEANNVG